MKCTADCSRPNGGPSAVQLGRLTRSTNVSGEFLYWLADCPLTLSRLSAIHLRQSTRDNDVSGRISNPNGGPSAVHSVQPPETTTSLKKILDSTVD